MFRRFSLALSLGITVLAVPGAIAPLIGASEQPLTIDHYVRLKSSAPAMQGQFAHLYVRERLTEETLRQRDLADRVVLFVHGAGTPAEVAFDVPHSDYSWMAYLAKAGFDVFSMDMTGYGRSTKPWPMDDPCNLSRDQQMTFVPSLIPAPCAASYTGDVTTIGSDWDDINAVVDHLRALRHVEKVSLIAWSLGGPRAGGFAIKHPEKVNRLVLLAPAPPAAPIPAANAAPFGTQSRVEFVANWDRQVGCAAQYDQAVSDSVWSEMQASDPVGATWGAGVRRASNARRVAGWDAAAMPNLKVPTLMVAGVHDKQVDPASVRLLHGAIGATDKVFIDLGCSSHNAMWEKNHLLLFEASRQWLTTGAVNGARTGTLRLGYATADTKTN